MNEPEKTPGEVPATPGKDARKHPVSGAVIESRPIVSGRKAADAPTDAKPPVESSLVGKPGATKPAAKRAAEAAKPAEAKPAPGKDQPKPESAPPAAVAAASSPAPKAAETRVEIRRAGFFPLFLGGIVAAGLGAGAAYWAIPHLPPSLRPGDAVDPAAQIEAARAAGAEAATAQITAQADALTGRAAEAGADAARQVLADSTPSAAPEIPAALTDRIAALEKGLSDLGSRPAPQPVEPAPVAGAEPAAPTPAAPPGVSQEALDALAARVNEQQARIDELAARPVVDPATAEQVQTLARQAEELQQSTVDANRRAQTATAASALQAAIEANAPRDQALADLAEAGIEVPAILTGDVPRLDQLRAEFPAAARDGLRVSIEAQPGTGGAMQTIGNFLRVQTGARSIEPRDGSDPDAVLSRANAAVEAGDISGALTEIGTLPEAGQQAMAGWTAKAATWVEANAALGALVAGSR